MFGPPGRLYAYLSHGIHVCANVVCGADGVAAAVLLSAAAIETGLDVAQSRRGASIRAPGAGRADRETSARRRESPWPTTELTCSYRQSGPA